MSRLKRKALRGVREGEGANCGVPGVGGGEQGKGERVWRSDTGMTVGLSYHLWDALSPVRPGPAQPQGSTSAAVYHIRRIPL